MLLRDLVAQYGPLLVFANVLAAAIGLPVPAMPTLVLFGAMSAMHPAMIGSQLVTVVALSVLGALIGDPDLPEHARSGYEALRDKASELRGGLDRH